MNRKQLGISAVVVILVLALFGAGAWWWLHEEKPSAARYLPSRTVCFVYAPDLSATRQSFQTSYIKRLIDNHDVARLFSLAWKQVSTQVGGLDSGKTSSSREIWDLFERNMTGEAFLAITDINFQEPSKLGFIIGIKPKQGLDDIPAFLDRVRKEAEADLKTPPKRGQGSFDGIHYDWLEGSSDSVRLCVASVGPWQIITIGEPALNDFITRFHQKATDDPLEKNTNYRSVLARLNGRQDTLAYISVAPFQEQFVSWLQNHPESNTGNSIKGIEKLYSQLSAFGWGFRFQEGRVHETIACLIPKATRPDLGKTYEPCAYKTLNMTSSQTYFYLAQNMDFPKQWNYLLTTYTETTPHAAEMMKQLPEWAKAQGLDFDKNVLQAFGNEYAMIIDWPAESLLPDMGLVLDVAKPDDFKPTVTVLLKNLSVFASAMALDDSKAGNYGLKVARIKQVPMISPTLITSGDRFGIFLTESGAKRMLEGNNASSLAKDPTFIALGGNKRNGTMGTIYVNLGGLIDHTYQSAKPYVGMAAMFSPQVQQLLGKTQLPEKLSFTADLGALLILGRADDESSTTETISNTGTLPLAVAGLSAITGAAYYRASTAVTAPARLISNPPANATSGTPTAENIKAELEELRAVIDAYAMAQDIPKGTAVTWTAISSYLVPDSPLQKSGGKDLLGHPYSLGTIGEVPADISSETKTKFADKDENFWKPAPATPASADSDIPAPPAAP